MLRFVNSAFLSTSLLLLSACDMRDADTLGEHSKSVLAETPAELVVSTSLMEPTLASPPISTFKTVEWIDLMPKEDLDALLNPPSYVTDVEDGSFEDLISNKLQNSTAVDSEDRYQQALSSTRIIPEMDGQAIRIPGFIVPLEFNDDKMITGFFLVPFFGACIHVPPPPPNQIIFVSYPQGLKLDNLYDPFWISGVLQTSQVENEVATASYSMQMQSSEMYTE